VAITPRRRTGRARCAAVVAQQVGNQGSHTPTQGVSYTSVPGTCQVNNQSEYQKNPDPCYSCLQEQTTSTLLH